MFYVIALLPLEIVLMNLLRSISNIFLQLEGSDQLRANLMNAFSSTISSRWPLCSTLEISIQSNLVEFSISL